jgi:hypothetical protein
MGEMVKRENDHETSATTPITSPSWIVIDTAAGLQQTAQSSIM